MNAERYFELVKGVIAKCSPKPINFDASFSVQWLPLTSLLQKAHSSFMGEHVVVFYCQSGQSKFSMNTRFACNVAQYPDLVSSLKGKLEESIDVVNVINPYRFKIPELPFVGPLREHFRHVHGPVKTQVEHKEDLGGYFEDFGRQLIEYRRRLCTTAIDDPWGKYVIPSWNEPTGLVYLYSADKSLVVSFDCIATADFVHCEESTELDMKSAMDLDVEQHLPILKKLPHWVQTRKVRSSFGNPKRIFDEPLAFAFKEYCEYFDGINSSLEDPDGCLGPLSEKAVVDLVRQKYESRQRLKREWGVGPELWSKALDVKVRYSSESLHGSSLRFQSIHYVAKESHENSFGIYRGDDGAKDAGHDVINRPQYIEKGASIFSFWMQGLDLSAMIDENRVSSRILDRDTSGRWDSINRKRKCRRVALFVLHRRTVVNSDEKIGRAILLKEMNASLKEGDQFSIEEVQHAINWLMDRGYLVSRDPLELSDDLKVARDIDMIRI